VNTDKLNEALVELRHQRALLDAAISNIEGVLKTLQSSTSEPRSMSKGKKHEGSYIDLGVQVLEEAGTPLHIKEIAERISKMKGKNIPRASVESSFIRHIANFSHNSRIVKVQPAYFTVPSLKNSSTVPLAHLLSSTVKPLNQ
jgi:hypothetical protein